MFLKLIFQYLIFLTGKVIETVTVHEIGSGDLFFLDVLRLICEWFLGENTFFQSFDSCFNVLGVKTLIS